jgi:DNA-binding transcriptional ArsR family regulator
MPVTWERRSVERLSADRYRDVVRVHASPNYDFLASLRALYHPSSYDKARAWAGSAKAKLGPEAFERGRFFFLGEDTGLGYGAVRLVADLDGDAGPEDLVRATRDADAHTLALYLLDTGETTDETLVLFKDHLAGPSSEAAVDGALRGMAPEWAKRCRRVLREPEVVRAELADLLETYLRTVFAAELPHLAEPLERAAVTARELLRVFPTTEAIEHLTGGYTFAEDLALKSITLAPSVFIYPFMSARVDVFTGDALIIYGVRSDLLERYEAVPLDTGLVQALKALSDPGRLKVVRLVGQRPMFGPELVAALGLSQPTMHHHLARLRAAGLVRQERTKNGMRYTIRRDAAATVTQALQKLFAGED